MSRKKKKRRKLRAEGRGSAGAGNGDLKMSEVILKLAEPLLTRYGNSPQRFESIIVLTIAAWNKALLPAYRQGSVEQELIDAIIPKDGSAQDVAAIVQAMDIIEERRKQLFPNLRKLIASYDLEFSDGRVSLNVGWAPIPADRCEETSAVQSEADAGHDEGSVNLEMRC